MKVLHMVILTAALVLSEGLVGTVSAFSPAQPIAFDVPAQPLPKALNEFARQSDLRVIFLTEVTERFQSSAVRGSLTPEQALKLLLPSAELSYRFFDDGSVEIISNAAGADKAADDALPARALQLTQANPDGARGVVSPQVDTSSANSSQVDDEPISEVLVTATKREERVLDVPISMAVVTAEEIDRRGLASAADYLRGIPGVNQVDSAEGQSIVIRGMETSPYYQNFSSGPTTATYFGETPTTTAGGLGTSTNVDIKLVDIERIEVLRGPQGTSFGNSSIGGAVRMIPVTPKLDRFAAKVAAGYSDTADNGGGNHNAQLVGNIPLVKDRLAIRAAAYQYRDSGFYRNVAGSDPAFQAAAVIPYGAQGFASDAEEVGSSEVTGARVAALLQISDNLRLTANYLTQKSETDGFAIATRGAYEQTMLEVAPEHIVRGRRNGVSDMDIDIANAVLEYDLGWGDLLATYSHSTSGSIVAAPYQLSGRYWPTSYTSDSEHREDVGEMRVTTRFNGPLNFLAGVYAEDLSDEVLFDYRWFGDPATNIACGPCVGRSDIGNQLQLWDLRQKAAFGEISWRLAPRFTFTGGARTYDYERVIRTSSPRNFFFAPVLPGTARTASDATGTTFRGNLGFKPVDDVLVYAGWSQGFRLGKPQPALPVGICDLNGDGTVDGTSISLASTGSVESDDVDNFELGGKFALLDRRLTVDAAVFRMEWSGLPVRVGTPAPCNRAYNTNAGSAVSEGVELQASLQATAPFRIDFGGSWINAKLTEDVPLQGFSSGDRLAGSPEVNANLGVQFEFDIGGYKAHARADSIYVGSFYGDILESPNTKSGGYVKLDASMRLEIRNLNVDLFVRNLTDEDAFTFRGILPASPARPVLSEFYGYRLRPRTIGLQLGYSF